MLKWLFEMLNSDPLSPSDAAVAVLISSLAWTTLFTFCYFVGKVNRSLYSSLVHCIRLLHSIIVLILASNTFDQRPYPFLESGEDNSPHHNTVLVVSDGFYISNLVLGVVTQSGSALGLAGDSLSAALISVALYSQDGGAEMMVEMFIMESTTPLQQLCEILKITTFKDGVLHTSVECLFLLLFILIRVFAMGFLIILALADPFMVLHVTVAFLLWYTLSLIMLYYRLHHSILKYIKKEKQS